MFLFDKLIIDVRNGRQNAFVGWWGMSFLRDRYFAALRMTEGRIG